MMLVSSWAKTPEHRWTFNRQDWGGLVVFLGCGVVTVLDARTPDRKIAVAVLLLWAEIGLLLGRRVLPHRWGALGMAITIGTGLAATVLAPSGLGEIPVLVGTSALPLYLPEGRLRYLAMGASALAFGITVVVISGSVAGLLAGAGTWLLAGRAIEHTALQAERDRAVALLAEVEASRQAQRDQAAAEERNRIAREMHDVLAHTLAGLSMQLQAIRAVAAHQGVPASVTGPLDRAARLARDGVQEARAAVGALRGARLRGVDDLDSLIETFPGGVSLEHTGQPGEVAPEAGHAVYRAVQEAMTNSARYATGSRIDVGLAWDPSELRVRVRDHGLPPGHLPSGVQGGGTGLGSMIERVEAAGGTLTAGPCTDGPGWQVEVHVPAEVVSGDLDGPAAPGAAAAGSAPLADRTGGKMGT